MTQSQWQSGETNVNATGLNFRAQDAGSTFAASNCPA
jgi:hypothetical protein